MTVKNIARLLLVMVVLVLVSACVAAPAVVEKVETVEVEEVVPVEVEEEVVEVEAEAAAPEEAAHFDSTTQMGISTFRSTIVRVFILQVVIQLQIMNLLTPYYHIMDIFSLGFMVIMLETLRTAVLVEKKPKAAIVKKPKKCGGRELWPVRYRWTKMMYQLISVGIMRTNSMLKNTKNTQEKTKEAARSSSEKTRLPNIKNGIC